ncbi:hypothetical protein [Luteibacter sp. 22Crub2.1]|uniref:hypothetical protein n=1 Tax=Luteibacter sp. 22Crub2.1 TaxID=1283288 RepID=UPI0009A71ECD|nr:hypothetical protein [Luteibacter sp. 22Crub2.1]SKB73639.1 hypothetical protein SAMN05660880_02368 [Luteibacter sp. 22Crub2.1]
MHSSAWRLDGQDLINPEGRRIPLREIQNWAMARHDGRQDIQTDKWRGWRIVQQYLVPPGRTMANGGISLGAIKSLVFHEEQEQVLRALDDA